MKIIHINRIAMLWLGLALGVLLPEPFARWAFIIASVPVALLLGLVVLYVLMSWLGRAINWVRDGYRRGRDKPEVIGRVPDDLGRAWREYDAQER